MSRDFLELKRDINAFSVDLENYMKETGTKLDAAAEALEAVIETLENQITA